MMLYAPSKTFHPLAAGDGAGVNGPEHTAAFQRPEHEVVRCEIDHVHAVPGGREVVPFAVEARHH